jgi:hypothetical protein
VAGEATAGSSWVFRLDPHTLPVRGSARDGGAAHTAFILDRERAIVQRQRHAGATITQTVPLTSYRGVAVRMEPAGAAGHVQIFVELLHTDPALTLPLIVGDEPEDVAADWQAWGRVLNLPLLVIGQDGSVSAPLGDFGGIVTRRPRPRRRHSFFAGRRPRFLTRRKTGHAHATEQLAGREIIARN